MHINRTKDYENRIKEQKLVHRNQRKHLFNNIKSSKRCMTCGDLPTHTYPLYHCTTCFNILYTPKSDEITLFYLYYRKFKECSTLKEYRHLIDRIDNLLEINNIDIESNNRDDICDVISCDTTLYFRNLRDAIFNKIRKLLDDVNREQRLEIMREQLLRMEVAYKDGEGGMSSDEVVSYKRAISLLVNEIENLMKV